MRWVKAALLLVVSAALAAAGFVMLDNIAVPSAVLIIGVICACMTVALGGGNDGPAPATNHRQGPQPQVPGQAPGHPQAPHADQGYATHTAPGREQGYAPRDPSGYVPAHEQGYTPGDASGYAPGNAPGREQGYRVPRDARNYGPERGYSQGHVQAHGGSHQAWPHQGNPDAAAWRETQRR